MCSDKIQGNVEELDQFLFLIGSIKIYMYMYVFRVFQPYFCYALNILLWKFDKYTEKNGKMCVKYFFKNPVKDT